MTFGPTNPLKYKHSDQPDQRTNRTTHYRCGLVVRTVREVHERRHDPPFSRLPRSIPGGRSKSAALRARTGWVLSLTTSSPPFKSDFSHDS